MQPAQTLPDISHVTRHTSHVTRHKSHVTRHTSHVTPYCAVQLRRRGRLLLHTRCVRPPTSQWPAAALYLLPPSLIPRRLQRCLVACGVDAVACALQCRSHVTRHKSHLSLPAHPFLSSQLHALTLHFLPASIIITRRRAACRRFNGPAAPASAPAPAHSSASAA